MGPPSHVILRAAASDSRRAIDAPSSTKSRMNSLGSASASASEISPRARCTRAWLDGSSCIARPCCLTCAGTLVRCTHQGREEDVCVESRYQPRAPEGERYATNGNAVSVECGDVTARRHGRLRSGGPPLGGPAQAELRWGGGFVDVDLDNRPDPPGFTYSNIANPQRSPT